MKLTNVENFDVNDFIFSDPVDHVVNKKVNFKYVKIQIKDADKKQNLIIPTDKCFSWAVQN